jgi:tRNA modification GTPase
VHDLSSQPTIEQNLEVNVPLIKVFNKIDLIQNLKKNIQGIYISANTGEGLEDLYDAIKQSVKYESAGDGAFSARMRHKDAIKNAINHFSLGKKALIHEHAGEIFAEEIKLCQAALHEMTGVIDSDDLLGRIFSEFCIGK